MALDVINEVKAAEQKAQQIRQTAAAAAKDAVKLAAEQNRGIMEKELDMLRKKAAQKIEEAEKEARAAFDEQSAQRSLECEQLKLKAQKNLSHAAEACLERILR